MAKWLKSGAEGEAVQAPDQKVQSVAEAIPSDIEERGDAAVLELSQTLEGVMRDDFCLSQAEIDACLAQMSDLDLRDLEFAQTQVRGFAETQRAAMQDVEVETLPGGIQAVGAMAVGTETIKPINVQVLTDDALAKVGHYASRLSLLEGFAGLAEQAKVRVRRFGGQTAPYATPGAPRQGEDQVAA